MESSNEITKLLIVDDNPNNLFSFEAILKTPELEIATAASGDKALQTLLEQPNISLILMDVQMPGMDGFETAELIRGQRKFQELPILFITAVYQSDDFARRSFDVGAFDYITKPVDSSVLKSKVQVFLTLERQKKELAQANAQLQAEIIVRKKAEEQLTVLATTDPLTNALNRRHFMTLAEIEFERASRYDNNLSVIMIDLDHFKQVNDSHGHATGDLVLQELVVICQSTLRSIDIVARYGGEEFVILLPETDIDGALLTAERLRQRIEAATIGTLEGPLSTTASFGVACLDEEQQLSVETLLDHADQALYAAKAAGRNRVMTREPVSNNKNAEGAQ